MDVISLATKNGPPQWQLLLGLLDDAIYGGRLDNPFDQQVRSCMPCGEAGHIAGCPTALSSCLALSCLLHKAKRYGAVWQVAIASCGGWTAS